MFMGLRGVIAGAAFALAELWALLHADIVAVCSAVPSARLAVYVDDGSVGAEGGARRAAARAHPP